MNGPSYEQIVNRIARVFRHRRKWARRSAVSCFRVYDRDIPDQPFICDWYDGDAVVWTLDRARNETPEAVTAWEDLVLAAVGQGLGLPAERIHAKHRRRQKDRQEGDGQYHRLGDSGGTRLVAEGDLRLEVNLDDYLDTGLFLDHRTTRALVRAEATGRTALNLFAYTGSFTCHMAAGGARETLTVDLSNTYLAWAERNLAHNGLSGPQHRFQRADCLKFLAAAPAQRFDLIVCDPPTFSNSTAMERSWDVQRDHPWLLARLHAWLNPGGILWFSTNRHGFRLDGALPEFATCDEVTARTRPEDFADRTPHRCWRMTRR